MSERKEELRPCPFCGGGAEQAEATEPSNIGGSFIGCTQCLASTRVFFGELGGLVDAWNTRADTRYNREGVST